MDKFPFGNQTEILELADRYWRSITQAEKEAEKNRIPDIVNTAQDRGYLSKDEFIELGRWKSRERNVHNYEKNTEDCVENITQDAFSATTREGALRRLDDLKGVALPTASAILHWFRDDTPIIDFRVVQALGCDISKKELSQKLSSKDKYVFYAKVADKVIQEAKRVEVSLRDMDRALWAWHKINNPGSSGKCA